MGLKKSKMDRCLWSTQARHPGLTHSCLQFFLTFSMGTMLLRGAHLDAFGKFQASTVLSVCSLVVVRWELLVGG